MADILVMNVAGLNAAISAAKAGDTIKLAPGNYGDITINSKNYATDVTIKSLDANNPAEFRSLLISKSSGITIDNVDIELTPTATTTTANSALRISNSSDITFRGGEIHGGDAVSGVLETATTLDKTGNVIGRPTGRGVTVEWSKDVKIEASEISHFHKGIALNASSGVSITDNNIHDVRTGMISGVADNLYIEGNTLSGSHPWNWGAGDHADFIHLWTVTTQTGATSNITIVNNEITQGDGVAILGIYLDDNNNGKGFTNVNVSGNLLVNGNSQGVRFENVSNSQVHDNTFLQSSGSSKEAPGIYLTAGTHHVDVAGNLTGYVADVQNTNGAYIHDNVLIQGGDVNQAGYYDEATIQQAIALTDASAAKNLVLVAVDDHEDATISGAATAAPAAETLTVDTDLGAKLTAKSGANHILTGAAGGDSLTGLGGNDSLSGNGGNDVLNGGGGADSMSGGAGSDTFNFDGKYLTDGQVDVIFDFSSAQGDKIKVHSIDANMNTTATNEAFTFIGNQAFHHTAGELRYEVKGADAFVMGDVNGDGMADFQIKLVGVGSLTKADFVL